MSEGPTKMTHKKCHTLLGMSFLKVLSFSVGVKGTQKGVPRSHVANPTKKDTPIFHAHRGDLVDPEIHGTTMQKGTDWRTGGVAKCLS